MIDAEYAIQHNLWATGRLLEYAQSLSRDHLSLTVAGTAGSIRFCLAHIVAADQRYLTSLGAQIEAPFQETEDCELDDMTRIHQANAQAWKVILAAPPALDGWLDRPTRHDRLRRVMLPAQAIHHGTDHRTQVGTILLHHGLSLPELDVWAYASACGDYERSG